jgi:DNA-binding NarL/FixJ family response regulator
MKSIHVLLTDDHLLFRKGLIAALTDIRSHWKFTEAANGAQAVEILSHGEIDVVIMDVQMPVMGGFEAARIVKRNYPDVPVLMLTQFEEQSLILHFLQMGVNGFLSKNSDPEKVVEAIEVVFNRERFVNDQMLRALEVSIGTTPCARVRLDLSSRDRDIILLLKQGKNSRQIATHLQLSEASIESYRKDLLHKTRTRNVAELVSLVHRTGLV